MLDHFQNNAETKIYGKMTYEISSKINCPLNTTYADVILHRGDSAIGGNKSNIDDCLIKQGYQWYRTNNNRYRYLRYFKRNSFRPCMQIQG